MLPKPYRLDMLIFWIDIGADGIFVMMMTIMLARQASSPSGVMQPLERNQIWRDVGAAVGPIGAGLLIGIVTPEAMHLVLAAICAVTLLLLMTS